ncbi:MAG: alpha/beta hydrolase, partial [Spirochaetales bacterium]|nr:alpha/beta hydrolase [Spirochaetales bacterium]
MNWSAVQAEVALITRVCSYDRPGFGWSDPTDDVIYSPDVAESLHTLLNNAGETGPYILVGHSYGGIHVRNFAHLFPDDVSGIVLVDSSHDQQRAN